MPACCSGRLLRSPVKTGEQKITKAGTTKAESGRPRSDTCAGEGGEKARRAGCRQIGKGPALQSAALPQSRARPARVQPPRAGAGRGRRCRCSSGCASCASSHQPRRILRDPRRRPEGADQARRRRHRPGRRSRPRDVFREVSAQRARAGRAPVPAAERGVAARARAARASASCAARDWNDAQQAVDQRDYFFREMHAGADADRPRSGASVPARPQQEPELRRASWRARDAFGRNSRAAIVQAPRVLPRVIRLPRERRRAPTTTSSSCPRSCTRTSASSSPA